MTSEDDNVWVCPFCKGPLETLTHIFLDCVLAKSLWGSSPLSLNLARFSSSSVSDWILAVIFPHAKLDIPKACRRFQLHAALVMDSIWLAHNKLIFEASLPNPMMDIQKLKATMQQHCMAWNATALPSLWLPFGVGFLKDNFDVASMRILLWQQL